MRSPIIQHIMATVRVKVIASSSRDTIVGWLGDALKIKVTAPPEKGKANAAVVDLLASELGIDSRSVAIKSGHASPMKVLTVEQVTDMELRSALEDTSS